MLLDRVTITGADDDTPIAKMLRISKDFPFVEWGILASESNEKGAPRFPNRGWCEFLLKNAPDEMQLSLHLCGRWVRQLLLGVDELPGDGIDPKFRRVQLNFHAERTKCKPTGFFQALLTLDGPKPRQWIFQHDGSGGNDHHDAVNAEAYENNHVDAVALFDVSGGAGIVPTEWPAPEYIAASDGDREDYAYHGYAGGIGPDNVLTEIERIRKVVDKVDDHCRIWIDMETRVRTNERLDLDKVVAVLEACRGHVWRKKEAVS